MRATTPRGALRAIVAEVNNTFGERHHYVLRDAGGAPLRDGATLRGAQGAPRVAVLRRCAGTTAFRFRFAAGALARAHRLP